MTNKLSLDEIIELGNKIINWKKKGSFFKRPIYPTYQGEINDMLIEIYNSSNYDIGCGGTYYILAKKGETLLCKYSENNLNAAFLSPHDNQEAWKRVQKMSKLFHKAEEEVKKKKKKQT